MENIRYSLQGFAGISDISYINLRGRDLLIKLYSLFVHFLYKNTREYGNESIKKAL